MHGFTLVQSSTIPDISAQLYVFDHDQSGARLITLSNSDSNKAFGAAFPTPPEDNSGVAHVLEHSVLCGSRSYPTKDPFATLLQSSHQTFLNALTYPDRTCYPVASCNGQDLYNLADVYIDSLLHPKVVEEDYIIRQEGWRVQPGEAPEETSTLQGVVYNEMKGVYSSADMLHYRMIGRALNPENCYRFDSGGDPGCIPRELNQEGLVEFYKAHYHPGRGLFWFYGDGEVGKQVEWLSGKLGEYNRPKSSLDFDNAQKYMQL
ncbi:zinc metalloprotease, putative [Perkinsus marinus ATCC 50983]|uniref:Zinc metalloprotease, putative n=1 Tax=Perkinsus marinus (strain ATCC 50983 / TXsc) TaxID=423536 RepID=C5LYP0_PERM5|nr:zinc metalloprotease, putative [Perkinsus marinus ATCC 50983]EEQ98278.1 zinc metalloprotease, putative [Perkinsus marinus ATCC 50983]|eukprot:XP_002765561.1 zinc metalloprotease, putative [Perkinsus marinus ATCC 50983]